MRKRGLDELPDIADGLGPNYQPLADQQTAVTSGGDYRFDN